MLTTVLFLCGKSSQGNNCIPVQIDIQLESKILMQVSQYQTLTAKDARSYDERASNYEEVTKSMNYIGPKSVGSKWLSYNTKLGTNPTGLKHTIFDAGCGTGLVGEALVTLVPGDLIEIYGGDVSSKMLEVARSKNVYSDLQIVNLYEELPYEADSFDSVTCAGVFGIDYLVCGPECIPNLIRVLKKGCYLFATIIQKVYDENEEWKQQIKDCNCELIEDNEIPYRTAVRAVLIVVRKPLDS